MIVAPKLLTDCFRTAFSAVPPINTNAHVPVNEKYLFLAGLSHERLSDVRFTPVHDSAPPGSPLPLSKPVLLSHGALLFPAPLPLAGLTLITLISPSDDPNSNGDVPVSPTMRYSPVDRMCRSCGSSP